jgi:hypothetical protein
MGGFLNALRGDSPPFIVTLLFAAIAWYLTYVVDTARKLPLLEQRIDVAQIAPADAKVGEHYATLFLENLSEQMFQDTRLEVVLRDNDGCIQRLGRASAYPPAPGLTVQPIIEDCSMSITLPEMQPENRLGLGFYYVGSGTPTLMLRSTATSSHSGVMAVPPSLTTFFIRNQTCLLTVLLALFVVVTVISLVPSRREDFYT